MEVLHLLHRTGNHQAKIRDLPLKRCVGRRVQYFLPQVFKGVHLEVKKGLSVGGFVSLENGTFQMFLPVLSTTSILFSSSSQLTKQNFLQKLELNHPSTLPPKFLCSGTLTNRIAAINVRWVVKEKATLRHVP